MSPLSPHNPRHMHPKRNGIKKKKKQMKNVNNVQKKSKIEPIAPAGATLCLLCRVSTGIVSLDWKLRT